MVDSISPAMEKIHRMVQRVAPTDLSVLIGGESGVGKEIVAQQIYSHSLRRDQPLVKINSAAIPETLFESELFGHRKGAFTGANQSRGGHVQEAHKGTLFFDEIAELNPDSQGKLLHIIHDREYTPLGTNHPVSVDLRILAATNKNLWSEVEQGNFREDLYYRLNVVQLDVPPLREHKEDIPNLAEYFITKYRDEFKKPHPPTLGKNQYEEMGRYDWPGNVRELENFVKRLVLLGDTHSAFEGLKKKRGNGQEPNGKPSLLEATRMVEEEVERKIIGQVLQRNGWNRKRTAETLRISYRSLLSKIKKLEIA